MSPDLTWTHGIRRKLARLLLQSLPLEVDEHEIAPIDPAVLDEIRERFPLTKFFIFGHPRSGTTLLMRLVRLHPEVHCHRQAHFFTSAGDATQIFADAEIRAWLARKSNRWTAGENLEAGLVRLVADFIMERAAQRLGKSIVGDKTPNSNAGQAVRRLRAVYPDGRLIYIIRDGRDAVVSRRFQRFIDQPQHMTGADRRIRELLARDSAPFFEGRRSIFTPASLKIEAEAWRANVEDTLMLGERLFSGRFLSLRYEDMLAEPMQELSRVWQFLGAEPKFPEAGERIQATLAYNPGAAEHRKKEGDLVRDLPRGGSGTWRQLFTPRDRQIFKAAAGSALIACGYESDLNW